MFFVQVSYGDLAIPDRHCSPYAQPGEQGSCPGKEGSQKTLEIKEECSFIESDFTSYSEELRFTCTGQLIDRS